MKGKIETFFLLISIEGAIALSALLYITRDSKSSWFFGYSPKRLGLVLGILVIEIFSIWIFIGLRRNSPFAQRLFLFLKRILQNNLLLLVLVIASILSLILGIIYIPLLIFLPQRYGYSAYLTRLAPLIFLIAAIGTQLLWFIKPPALANRFSQLRSVIQSRISRYQFDFLLMTLLSLFLFLHFFTFYADRADQYRGFSLLISTIRPYIIPSYYALLGVTVLVVLINAKHIKFWLIGEIEAQRLRDKEVAAKRADHFKKRVPSLVSTPIFGQIAIKVSQEGYRYVLVLLMLALFGLILRLWNLDVLPPYADEISHLNSAKAIFQGVPPNQIDYRRSFYIVTLPVVLFFNVFGMNLWSARFAGVFVNILALIPLYQLGKRINKPIALLAVGLYVFSPWMIAVSRNVREYAYYPMFFYLTVLVMVKFYEAVPDHFVYRRDYHMLYKWKNLLFLAILGFILFYIYRIDSLSTFKIILVLYPIFCLLLFRIVDWRNPSNIMPSIFLLTAGGVLISWLLISAGGKYVIVDNNLNDYFFLLIYDNPSQQWYFNRPLISIVVLILALLATTLWNKRYFVLPFTVLAYIATILSFSLFNIKSERPRYAISIEFWHILLMAVGLFAAYIIVGKIFKYKYQWAIWVVLLLLFWNIPQTITSITHTTSGRHPITDEHHVDMAPAYSFLHSHTGEDDVIITTNYFDFYNQWRGEITSNKVIYYIYQEPDATQVLLNAIETHPSGWIALDYLRGYSWTQPVPLEDFIHADKQVKYLGWFGDVYIMRWGD